MNSAHETHHRTAIESGQAIVVIGVGLDTASPPSSFSIALDEYSITKGKITGNCFHYNHIQANLPAVQTDVKYFAYIVPAGVYVYSSFNGNPPPHPAAFIAPSGKAVYFGDYVYVGDHDVELRRSLTAAKTAVRNLVPRDLMLTQAESWMDIDRGTAFLCTP
jgi:hypothetical protein